MAVIGANGKARGGSGDKWDACHLLISLQSSANNLPGLTHTHTKRGTKPSSQSRTLFTQTHAHIQSKELNTNSYSQPSPAFQSSRSRL